MRTVEYWLAGAPVAQRAKLMTQHAKAGLHERRFAILMNENFEKTGDFERWGVQPKNGGRGWCSRCLNFLF